jgi:bromodomain and WD repeat domain-containing protein 1/3
MALGGSYLAVGSTDNAFRVYFLNNDDPIKIAEIEYHTRTINCIQFANNSVRFLSGSGDGTARIWCFENMN